MTILPTTLEATQSETSLRTSKIHVQSRSLLGQKFQKMVSPWCFNEKTVLDSDTGVALHPAEKDTLENYNANMKAADVYDELKMKNESGSRMIDSRTSNTRTHQVENHDEIDEL